MHEDLLKRLNSKKGFVTGAALAEARQLPPDELLQLASLEAATWRRRKRIVNGSYIAIITLVVGIFLIRCITERHFDFQLFQMLNMMNLVAVVALPKRGRKNVATLIEERNDPRFLGPALEQLADPAGDEEVRKSASIAVKRLLPQLRADQANLLTEQQRKALLIPLERPVPDIDLTLAILKALEQVGDESAIPAVEKLTELAAIPENERGVEIPEPASGYYAKTEDKERRISAAAWHCLPFLKLNAERKQQSQTLLRASASITTTPDMLLRPAAGFEDTTPNEELLRAATKEERTDRVNVAAYITEEPTADNVVQSGIASSQSTNSAS